MVEKLERLIFYQKSGTLSENVQCCLWWGVFPQNIDLQVLVLTYFFKWRSSNLIKYPYYNQKGDIVFNTLHPTRLIRVHSNSPFMKLHFLRFNIEYSSYKTRSNLARKWLRSFLYYYCNNFTFRIVNQQSTLNQLGNNLPNTCLLCSKWKRHHYFIN